MGFILPRVSEQQAAQCLDNKGLLKPGDVLLDRTKLPNRLTRGGEDGRGKGRIGFYTPPSIKYSELDSYTYHRLGASVR